MDPSASEPSTHTTHTAATSSMSNSETHAVSDHRETKRRRRSRWDSSESYGTPLSSIHTQQCADHTPSSQPITSPLLSQPTSDPNTNSTACRIYVGSLHYELKIPEIKMLFSSFGNIVDVDLSMEPGTDRSKGYCFIEYDTPAAAEAAMAMNNFELAGRNIKVGRPHSTCGGASTSVPPPVLSPHMTPKEQAQILLAQAIAHPEGNT